MLMLLPGNLLWRSRLTSKVSYLKYVLHVGGFSLNSCPNVEDQFNFPLIFLYICEFQLTYHYRLKIGGIRNRTLVAFFKWSHFFVPLSKN